MTVWWWLAWLPALVIVGGVLWIVVRAAAALEPGASGPRPSDLARLHRAAQREMKRRRRP